MNWVRIGSGDGLAPVRRHTITWTNDYLSSIWTLETYFNENGI